MSEGFLQCCGRLRTYDDVTDLLNKLTNGRYDKGLSQLYFTLHLDQYLRSKLETERVVYKNDDALQ